MDFIVSHFKFSQRRARRICRPWSFPSSRTQNDRSFPNRRALSDDPLTGPFHGGIGAQKQIPSDFRANRGMGFCNWNSFFLRQSLYFSAERHHSMGRPHTYRRALFPIQLVLASLDQLAQTLKSQHLHDSENQGKIL